MPWKSVRRIIAGIFQTSPSGKRIVIDGTGTEGNVIQLWTGVPNETAPGHLSAIPLGSPAQDAAVELAAPELSGAAVPKLILDSAPNPDDSLASLDSPGVISLVATGPAEFTAALLQLLGTAGVTISGGTEAVTVTPKLAVTVIESPSGVIQIPDGSRIKRGGLATPTLLNGWTNLGTSGGRPFQPARYLETPDHRGQLFGVISGPGTAGQLFSLPAQMWPDTDQVVIVACNGGRKAQVVVQSDGKVFLQNVEAGITWVSLNTATWPLANYG
jgi:hypothetical protein